MKITNEILKQIIKEELDGFIAEESTPSIDISKEDAKKAEKVAKITKDSPEMQAIFDKLESDPKFMNAINKIKQQADSMNEMYEVPSGDEPTAGLTMIGSMVGAVAGWKVLYTAAGAAAVAAATPIIGATAASLGVVGAAVAAPVVIGFMLDRLGDAATGRKPFNQRRR